MRHYRNLEMWEERKNPEYHENLKAEAEARAKRWTEKRHEFGLNHPYLIIIISAALLCVPLVVVALLISLIGR